MYMLIFWTMFAISTFKFNEMHIFAKLENKTSRNDKKPTSSFFGKLSRLKKKNLLLSNFKSLKIFTCL